VLQGQLLTTFNGLPVNASIISSWEWINFGPTIILSYCFILFSVTAGMADYGTAGLRGGVVLCVYLRFRKCWRYCHSGTEYCQNLSISFFKRQNYFRFINFSHRDS
jgi:hypothetical protein